MDDEDLIPLSALQHFVYCPRQCALIHVERLWVDNQHTAEGRLLHDRVDTPLSERRKDVRVVTAMPLVNLELGIAGVADVVEFHWRDTGELAVPVEYKRGRPKAHRSDEVQLCGQGLCLEYMLGRPVPGGFLFYGKTRRRLEVIFDSELRALTARAIASVRTMLSSGKTPPASYDPKLCDRCSLIDLCQPRWLAHSTGIAAWVEKEMED